MSVVIAVVALPRLLSVSMSPRLVLANRVFVLPPVHAKTCSSELHNAPRKSIIFTSLLGSGLGNFASGVGGIGW